MSDTPTTQVIRAIFPPKDKVPGCPYCDSKSVKYGPDGQEFWHPSRDCCLPNLILQLLWRQDDIMSIHRAIDHMQREHERKARSKGISEPFIAPAQLRVKLEGDKRDPEYLSLQDELRVLAETIRRHPEQERREAFETVQASPQGRAHANAWANARRMIIRN